MPRQRKPKPLSLRHQLLGQQLRKLREKNGHTLEYAADYLECAMGTLSRCESGQYPIKRPQLIALLELYEVNKKTGDMLHRLRAEAGRKGWWEGFQDVCYDEGFFDLPWLESKATGIRWYAPTVIPGLLQTDRYAEAMIRAHEDPSVSEKQVARWVDLRLERQQILAVEDAPSFDVILDEAALRRAFGGRDSMLAQLGRLLEAARQPHTSIGVIPLANASHPSFVGGFTIYQLEDPFPKIAYVETLAGRIFVEDLAQVDQFERVYPLLQAAALPADESATFIAKLMKEFST